jgi:hypothetical protein
VTLAIAMDEGNGSFSDNEDEKSSEDLGCPSLSSDSDEHDGSDGGHLQNDSRQEEEDHCVDGLGVPEMDEAPKSEPSGGRRRRRREKNTKKKNADLDEDPSKGWDQSLDPSAIMRMSRLAERQARIWDRDKYFSLNLVLVDILSYSGRFARTTARRIKY